MLVEEGFNVVSVDASDKMLKYALKSRWERRKEPAFDQWGRAFLLDRHSYLVSCHSSQGISDCSFPIKTHTDTHKRLFWLSLLSFILVEQIQLGTFCLSCLKGKKRAQSASAWEAVTTRGRWVPLSPADLLCVTVRWLFSQWLKRLTGWRCQKIFPNQETASML